MFWIVLSSWRIWYWVLSLPLLLESLPMAQETCVHSQVESYQRLKNGTWYLFTQHYKVCIKGKVEQSMERSSVLPTLWCCSYWKGNFGSPSTTAAKFTLFTHTHTLPQSAWAVEYTDCVSAEILREVFILCRDTWVSWIWNKTI